MKKQLLFLLLLSVLSDAIAQKNLELVSRVQYPVEASDVWGYAAPDGTEYALMGLHTGVSIVSLADPAHPVEVQMIPGEKSAWRDLKTWGSFAFVVADQPGTKEGLLVIDLSDLPDEVQWYNWRPMLPNQTDSLFTCHNLWIDEFGYAYLSGCNVNNGGVVFLDLFSQPGLPQWVGFNPPIYAHDCYVRDNVLYTADIYLGYFSVYDVADKSDPALLATQETPFSFTHNAWLSADGKTLFTTDEKPNAPVAAFDISNLDNIRLLDEFRPPATLNTNLIPHNVHVLGDYLVISHYTDGCVIVDATNPRNLIEAGFYDTSEEFFDGFHGCWGAYPFFPSGLIAAADIENGLFILKPTLKRACYVEGKVTDAGSGSPINGATVSIQSEDVNFTQTSFTGDYKTGQITEGAFDVVFRAKGYFDVRVPTTLIAAETIQLDLAMTPLPPHPVSGQVFDKMEKRPIAGAAVFVENQDFGYTARTDGQGRFELPDVLEGEYEVFVGHWGYENLAEPVSIVQDRELNFELLPAYRDDFNNDLGWQVESDATNGFWERGVPVGTIGGGRQFAPGADSPNDPGRWAYVTGNQGVKVHDDEVNDGATTLISPTMQLRSRYNRPMLSFDYWFLNAISNFAATDSLTLMVDNGRTKSAIWFVATDAANVQEWTPSPVFDLAGYLEITDEMRIYFRVADDIERPNVLEAGIDNFKIEEGLPDSYFFQKDEWVKMQWRPNPFTADAWLDYKISGNYGELEALIFNSIGQQVWRQPLNASLGTIQLNLDLPPGAYYIALRTDGRLSHSMKIVKAP